MIKRAKDSWIFKQAIELLLTVQLSNPMIIRAGFLLVALVSAIAVSHINNCHSRKRSSSNDKHKTGRFAEEQNGREKGKSKESNVGPKEKREQIKTCRSESVHQLIPKNPQKNDYKFYEFLVQDKKWNYVTEINLLKKLVKEKEQRRENLELRLIELYCLDEQQSNISRLRKQLKEKMTEIEMLKDIKNKLEADRRELSEEVKQNHLAEKQLERAKLTILELQEKLELDAGQMKGNLMVLKQQILRFGFEGSNNYKVDKKLKDVKEVELKAMEMKRRNKELQHEKRDLVVKLDAAQIKIKELSSVTEHKMVARIEEEVKGLRCVKDNLGEQIERLHSNRFSILEELVYQRWLNYCLRFELQDFHSPQPKTRKPNIYRKLNSLSEDESEIPSADSDEVTSTTINSSSSSPSKKNKKSGLIHNMKRWGKRKDDSSANAQIRSLQDKAGVFRRFSMSFAPSRTSAQRNKRFKDSNSPEMPQTQRVRRVSFNDSLNSVACTYDDMPISDDLGSSNNDHIDVGESFSDFSDLKARPGSEEAEIRAARANVASLDSSRDLISNQNMENESIQTGDVGRNEMAQEECLGSGKPNAGSGSINSGHDQMVQFLLAFIIILLLLLISHFFY